jgi:hypothetical protein
MENFGDQYHDIRKARRMIDNAREISGEVRAAFGAQADVRFELGENDDHATIVTAMLCHALRSAGTAFAP